MKQIKTLKWLPKIEGAVAEVPFLVQTFFLCKPKKTNSGLTVPLISIYFYSANQLKGFDSFLKQQNFHREYVKN